MPANALEATFRAFLEQVETSTGYRFDDECRQETPRRIARMFLELVLSPEAISQEAERILSKKFSAKYRAMISYEDITSIGLCPHHLLPVHYKLLVAYIPDNLVIGASKFSRLAKVLAKQPILQEDYTTLISETIQKHLQPRGVAVIVRGRHSCMSSRGVRDNATMVTSALTGLFLENDKGCKDELLALANKGRSA